MNDLGNSVYHYYLQHWEELPTPKQLHLASRLYLWNQDADAKQKLETLRAHITVDNQPKLALSEITERYYDKNAGGTKNAAELRQPFFERYTTLKKYDALLFRTNFLETLYGVDARPAFLELTDMQEPRALQQGLLQDPEAIAILSTHAINFLYLFTQLFPDHSDPIDPAYFYQIGLTRYDLTNLLHLQLLIYLYTHCILGETRFYYHAIPAAKSEPYMLMMSRLEELIDSRFTDINLDNKCEFLVCAKITGFETKLAERIFAEAATSVSKEGTFIVDRHNKNAQRDNKTFPKSEHRNALLIMASRDFSPLA